MAENRPARSWALLKVVVDEINGHVTACVADTIAPVVDDVVDHLNVACRHLYERVSVSVVREEVVVKRNAIDRSCARIAPD